MIKKKKRTVKLIEKRILPKTEIVTAGGDMVILVG